MIDDNNLRFMYTFDVDNLLKNGKFTYKSKEKKIKYTKKKVLLP